MSTFWRLQLDMPGKKPKFTHICVLFISGILVVFIAVPMELFQMEPIQVSISCLVKNDELISATFLPTT